MDYNIFETDRCTMRPVSTEDAEFILKLVNTPKWLMYVGDRNIHSVLEAEKYISEKMVPHYETHGFGNYVVMDKFTNQKMGTCGLYDRPNLDGVDIGFAFLPEFEKQGFGFEAVSYLKEFAFGELGFKKIGAITTLDNIDSQKLLEKTGFTFIKKIKMDDDEVELMYYEINK